MRPHLEFAGPAWSPPWQEGDKECLEKVQKKAVTMVLAARAYRYVGRLLELGMMSLEERRHQTDMAQVYKILTGKDRC